MFGVDLDLILFSSLFWWQPILIPVNVWMQTEVITIVPIQIYKEFHKSLSR